MTKTTTKKQYYCLEDLKKYYDIEKERQTTRIVDAPSQQSQIKIRGHQFKHSKQGTSSLQDLIKYLQECAESDPSLVVTITSAPNSWNYALSLRFNSEYDKYESDSDLEKRLNTKLQRASNKDRKRIQEQDPVYQLQAKQRKLKSLQRQSYLTQEQAREMFKLEEELKSAT